MFTLHYITLHYITSQQQQLKNLKNELNELKNHGFMLIKIYNKLTKAVCTLQ